jgi:hypothetical protein
MGNYSARHRATVTVTDEPGNTPPLILGIRIFVLLIEYCKRNLYRAAHQDRRYSGDSRSKSQNQINPMRW